MREKHAAVRPQNCKKAFNFRELTAGTPYAKTNSTGASEGKPGSADGSLVNMKTLVRRVATGEYFEGPDKWTHNPSEAMNFKSIDRALEFIETWALEQVELAFAFTGTNQITRVPLDRIASRYSQD